MNKDTEGMELTKQLKNQHLLWRAGFGITYSDLDDLDRISPSRMYKKLQKQSALPPVLLNAASQTVRQALTIKQNALEMQMGKEEQKRFHAEQRRIINKQSSNDIGQLSLQWLNLMAGTEGRLREKMSLFWHGHFACRVNNSLYQQQLLHMIRTHALGSFATLLREVSKSAAMLAFLNNQQNKKKKPNENFAREVMELFTIGRGNYTETDVKEAARAFTGWQYEKDGSFVFNTKVHDEGVKKILGQEGSFSGDDVLNILLANRQTAIFITQKVYRYFVNNIPDAQHITWLSDRFYKSQYDIGQLMEDIFTSDWFYEAQNVGVQIKSPVAYLSGIRALLPMQLQNQEVQILLQRILGQWLFNPPNVAGWPGDKAWIDSSSLMLRLRIPELIQHDESLNIKPKGNDDVAMGSKEIPDSGEGKKKKAGSGYRILARINWDMLYQAFKKQDKDGYTELANVLLQVPLRPASELVVTGNNKTDLPAEQFKAFIIALMGTPEYQLC